MAVLCSGFFIYPAVAGLASPPMLVGWPELLERRWLQVSRALTYLFAEQFQPYPLALSLSLSCEGFWFVCVSLFALSCVSADVAVLLTLGLQEVR